MIERSETSAAIERLRAYESGKSRPYEYDYGQKYDDLRTLLAEVERLRADQANWKIAADDADAEAVRLRAEREALAALHREVQAVFSWNSGIRYEEPCPDCHGTPGVHACGCWADAQVEYVCAECHRLGGPAKAQWPCTTALAAGMSVLTANSGGVDL